MEKASMPYLPKYVNISQEAAIPIICTLIKCYDVMVSEAYNPESTEYCGNIAIVNGQIIIELVTGGGTLDRINHDGIIHKRYVTFDSLEHYICPEGLGNQMLDLIHDIRILPYAEYIIEFSCYSTYVGIYRKKYLAWEITNWKAGGY